MDLHIDEQNNPVTTMQADIVKLCLDLKQTSHIKCQRQRRNDTLILKSKKEVGCHNSLHSCLASISRTECLWGKLSHGQDKLCFYSNVKRALMCTNDKKVSSNKSEKKNLWSIFMGCFFSHLSDCGWTNASTWWNQRVTWSIGCTMHGWGFCYICGCKMCVLVTDTNLPGQSREVLYWDVCDSIPNCRYEFHWHF